MPAYASAFMAAALASLFLPSLAAPSTSYPNVTSTRLTPAQAAATSTSSTADEEGWIPFDSYGLMMHMAPRAECSDVGCYNHVDNTPESNPTFATPPHLRHGSRDIARKNGTLGWTRDGEAVYTLNEAEEDDNKDVGEGEGEPKRKNKMILLQVLTTIPESRPVSLLRRAFGIPSTMLSKRKSKGKKAKSKKSHSNSKKGKGKKGSSSLDLAKGVSDIMKGSTIL